MKKIYFILSLFAIVNIAFATDTTTIRIHDHTDMTWYGNYDEWGVLPDESLDYRKIYLHYTMGCATGGCSDWDYTSQIILRHRTGEVDSSLQTTPMITVNGNVLDTVMYSDTVYVYFWDPTSNNLDSSISNLLEIIFFNDAANPTTPTDTIYSFESGFYNSIFDTSGAIIDSFYVYPSSFDLLTYHEWHQAFDVIENYELARVITPYGGYLANDWEFTHTFDVTDFVQILRDSVEIRCHYSGWSSGFSATLDFEFIEGTPAREVVKFENVYSGGYNYTSSTDFESNSLVPKNFLIEQNSTAAMLKMTTTGHGFDNNQSAAEFKPIDYFVKIDGAQTHTQFNWDANCGENPIYPQGGTWIYDRANWCPGTRAQAFDHEITPYIIPGNPIEVNIDFQAYSWSGTQTPSYIIECQLFQYGDPNFTNSAEIIDIIKPSLKDEYSRKNPICGKPLITIRNYGSAPLTTLDIEYNVSGGTINTFNWTGNLAFLETEEVELPNLNSWGGSDNIFEVTIRNPNGQVDQYSANSIMQSEFDPVPEYPETFALWVGTNSGVINTLTQESETSWNFFNDNGTTLFSSGILTSNTQYRDTLSFEPGCYTFIMTDTDEDGLDFWANNDGGGMVRFREIGASWLKSFNADFGTNIVHQFNIEGTQKANNETKEDWKIFPNPTKNNILVEGFSYSKSEIIIIDNLGREVIKIISNKSGFVSQNIDMNKLKNGIYYVKINNKESQIIQKIVKK